MSITEKNNTALTTQSSHIEVPHKALTHWVTNPYIAAATSENTRKAYRSDIRHFEQWGGKLPATPELLIMYLQHFAALLNPRTLRRRLIAIKHWHTYQHFSDPTLNPIVLKTIIGIMRIHSKPKKKARPLSPLDLQVIIEKLHSNNCLIAQRDNALLQIGFFGALRRSEI
ncbi:MAG: site-specific integrase, partial [Gammaproteobacteria bacterium]|nr:site-specific integrase [Gammaproteobacteria bacterium]